MTMQDRLNELFEVRGMPTRCSEATNISQSLISNYRNGVEPSFSNMVLIADFFDVSLDWLACRPGCARDGHKKQKVALSNEETDLLHDFHVSDDVGRELILENAAAMAARFPSDETRANDKTLTA